MGMNKAAYDQAEIVFVAVSLTCGETQKQPLVEAIKAYLDAMPNPWLPKDTMPEEEGAPFLVLMENDLDNKYVLQVSWFEGFLYPDHRGSSIDWDDRIRLHEIDGWMPTPKRQHT